MKKTPGFKEDGFTIDTDNETYENTASSLESMDKLVIGLLIAAILVSVVILSLILTLWENHVSVKQVCSSRLA